MWNRLRSDMRQEALERLRWVKRTAERAEARARFVLGRRRRVAPLTEEQVQTYRRDGYLLVSGLMPEAIVTAARTAMWEETGADPSDPWSWPRLGPPPRTLRDERLLATYTDAVLGAAAQLSGADLSGFLRPKRVLTVNRSPTSAAWHVHEPHLDRSSPRGRSRTFPPPYWIGALTYLTGIQPHGGATMVWPRSHAAMDALARTDSVKYRYLSALGSAVVQVPLGEPVELTATAGDVLFHHYLCVHTGSENVGRTPRLALLHKW